MKKYLKVSILTSLVILLPIFIGLLLWNQLPEQLPSHWNELGQIDGYSSKAFGVFGFPCLMLLAHWLVIFSTVADPKRQNVSEKIRMVIFCLIPLLSLFISAMIYFSALGKEVKMELLMPFLLGVFFVVLGFLMPSCKHNYTIGIKVPWALNSEENWNRTHKLAGYVWVFGGVFMMISALFQSFWVVIAISLVMALIPTVYSYLLYRKGI